MTTYTVRFVHKIAPSAADTREVELSDSAFSDSRTLAKALRAAGVLSPGVRIAPFRVEGEKTIVFPVGTIWHSVIITAQ